ncbi:MAG: hypothetical protein J5646_06165 [Bacteroidales bacterium]|nr:hypothetical protein [Bacteroidales bacterium]
MQRVINSITVLALLLAVAPATFTACENTRPDITITFESDARGVRDALTGMSQSLADRLALLEAAMESGLADYQAELSQVQQAVDSLGGSLEEKLAAVMELVKLQGTSLEAKLALIEAAAAAGFADGETQQALLEEAIAALVGNAEQKLAALETAIRNQTAGLETKMGLIEAAVLAGFADQKQQQALIAQALDSLGESQEAKLAALKKAVESRLSSLDSKLVLIQTSVSQQFTDGQGAMNLLLSALTTLKGTAEGIDKKVDAIVKTLGSFDSTTDTISAVLASLRSEVSHIADFEELVTALEGAVRRMDLLAIQFTDFVVRDTLVISEDYALKIPYTVISEGEVQVRAEGSDESVNVSVEPDSSDPLKGKLAVTTGHPLSIRTRIFVKLQGKYKTVTVALPVVKEQMSGGEDKTLLYNQTYDEDKPLIFKYKSNTPTTVMILDSDPNSSPGSVTWVRLISDSSNEASAECVIKLAVDTNTGTSQRRAIVVVRNRVSKHEIKFTITQDFNSAH